MSLLPGLNSDEDRVRFLQNVLHLLPLTARHPRLLRVYGVCMEGAPLIRDGLEMLLVTEATHYQVTLGRLLQWASHNRPEVGGCRPTEHLISPSLLYQ